MRTSGAPRAPESKSKYILVFMKAATLPLEARRLPRQRRARATFELLLDACAALLDEGGLEAVTTNAIALRAGVNVATLYGYFPNKYAVLKALEERFAERREALVRGAFEDAESWQEALEVGLEGYVSLLVSMPGAGALLDAIRTCPELQALRGGGHGDLARWIAAYLRRWGMPAARSNTAAHVLVEASDGVVGLARRSTPRQRRRVLEEHKALVRAYLESAGLS